MVGDILPDTYRCKTCGFFKSSFPVRINELHHVDETAREIALKPLRLANFRDILDVVQQIVPPPASLLDVGSAHGWFLESATERGYRCTGIEPDREMAQR